MNYLSRLQEIINKINKAYRYDLMAGTYAVESELVLEFNVRTPYEDPFNPLAVVIVSDRERKFYGHAGPFNPKDFEDETTFKMSGLGMGLIKQAYEDMCKMHNSEYGDTHKVKYETVAED